jgi:hypothetical protein
LKEPVHRARAGQVGADLGHGAGLGPGRPERQAGEQALGQLTVGLQGMASLLAGLRPPAQREPDLEHEQLVVDQPLAGAADRGHVGWAVDRRERVRAAAQAVRVAQLLWDEVGHLPEGVQQPADHAA